MASQSRNILKATAFVVSRIKCLIFQGAEQERKAENNNDKWLTFIWSFLCSRNHANSFTCIVLFNLLNNSPWRYFCSSICTQEEDGIQRHWITWSESPNVQIRFIPSLCSYLLNSATICSKRGAPQKQEELTKKQEDQGGVPMDSSPEPTPHSLYSLA